MAQLVIAAAGSAIGGAVLGSGVVALGMTGNAIGWAIGSVAGSMLGPKQKSEGPRLNDLTVGGSAYGTPIPFVLGSPRLAGQIVWASNKREIATTTEQGKGGGGSEYTSYTYELDALILLTDNVVPGMTRAWQNGKLTWNKSAGADPATIAASDAVAEWRRITFYDGNPAQLPDPTYEAAVGAPNALAYRGRGTVFVEGWQLGSSGQVPNLTIELGEGGGPPEFTLGATYTGGTMTSRVAMCKIDATRALLIYDRTGFGLIGIVASIAGGVVTLGSPIVINVGVFGTRPVPMSVRLLNAGTGEFLVASGYTDTNDHWLNIAAQIIVVSGTTVSAPNPAAVVTNLPGTSWYGHYGSAEVFSSTGGAIMVDEVNTNGVVAAGMTFSGGIVTFGTLVPTGIRYGDNFYPTVLSSTQLVQYGRTLGGGGLKSVAVTFSGLVATPMTVYAPAAALTVENGGAIVDAGAGVAGILYGPPNFAGSNVSSVRVAWAGASGSYSNDNSNTNLLTGGPVPAPVDVEVKNYPVLGLAPGRMAPGGGYGTLITNRPGGGPVNLYSVIIDTEVEMAVPLVELAATGVSSASIRPDHVYLSSALIVFAYGTAAGQLAVGSVAVS